MLVIVLALCIMHFVPYSCGIPHYTNKLSTLHIKDIWIAADVSCE